MALELAKRYTVWSRGRLVGETDLGFIFRGFNSRTGWFYPTDQGEKLVASATGVSPAMRMVWAIGPDPTAEADLKAAVDAEERLELELRNPDGAVVETEDIGIIDTHYLLAIGQSHEEEEPELTPEEQSEVDAVLEDFSMIEDEPWQNSDEPSEMPRYQISVRLRDPSAIP
jgi:hypothetical protein